MTSRALLFTLLACATPTPLLAQGEPGVPEGAAVVAPAEPTAPATPATPAAPAAPEAAALPADPPTPAEPMPPPKVVEPPQPAPTPAAALAAEWTKRFTPDLEAFLSYKLDYTPDTRRWANEFAVTRAYVGAKIDVADHIKARLTLDSAARLDTAKFTESKKDYLDSDGDKLSLTLTSVKTSQAAYYTFLKFAFVEGVDLGVKGLGVRVGMAPFHAVGNMDKNWGYRFQNNALMDREKYLSSTYLGASVLYKTPGGHLDLQLSVVNGEGFNKPTKLAAKDVQFAGYFRPWAGDKGLLGDLLLGWYGTFGKYDRYPDPDRRLRTGLQLGAVDKRWVALGEVNFMQDTTAEAASRAETAVGMKTPLSCTGKDCPFTGAITSALNASAMGWVDGAVVHPWVEGVRLVAKYDYVNPNLELMGSDYHRVIGGVGYVFAKNCQLLVDTELTFFNAKAGWDDTKKAAVAPKMTGSFFVHTMVGF